MLNSFNIRVFWKDGRFTDWKRVDSAEALNLFNQFRDSGKANGFNVYALEMVDMTGQNRISPTFVQVREFRVARKLCLLSLG